MANIIIRSKVTDFLRHHGRIVPLLLVILLIWPGLSSCVKKTEPGNGLLRIAFTADNTSLVNMDPFQSFWIENRVILRNVAESLTDQNPETGQIIPWLAKSWTISPDGLHYIFKLRDDVSFSNGSPFNAYAVKIAFDSNKAMVADNPAIYGSTYIFGYDHSEVLDEHTIKIVLSRPNGGFLQALSTTVMSILAPESYKLSPDERSRGKIIGTGPFLIKDYTPGIGAVLEKRRGYAWPSQAIVNRGEAKIDRVEIEYIPEEMVRNGKFMQGSIDILWPRQPIPDTTINILKTRGASIYSRSLPGVTFAVFPNVKGGRILSDARVRKALQKAIDRKSYAVAFYGEGFPVVESIFETTTPYFKPQHDKLDYDPKGAAKILDGIGWKLRNDGYRYKNGERLVLVQNLWEENSGYILLQDQLRKIGIELKLFVMTSGRRAAATKAGHYDLITSYQTRGDPSVIQTFLDPRYARGAALASNAYTPEILTRAQQLFDEGLVSNDPTIRARVYGELQDLLIDEGVAYPIFERIWQAAVVNEVKGFTWTAEGFVALNDIEIKR